MASTVENSSSKTEQAAIALSAEELAALRGLWKAFDGLFKQTPLETRREYRESVHEALRETVAAVKKTNAWLALGAERVHSWPDFYESTASLTIPHRNTPMLEDDQVFSHLFSRFLTEVEHTGPYTDGNQWELYSPTMEPDVHIVTVVTRDRLPSALEYGACSASRYSVDHHVARDIDYDGPWPSDIPQV